MTHPQHDDPFAEARTHLVQGLAVLATVGEATARWAAVRLTHRLADQQASIARTQQLAAAARAARRQRAAETAQARVVVDQALGPWLQRATLPEVARAWRTAAAHTATGDPRAARVVALAQERMRHLHGPFMDAYDRHRAAGIDPAAAMRAAAQDVAAMPQPGAQPWAHGGPHHPALGQHGPQALPAGGWRILNDLDAAVRAEAGRLAAHVSVEALDRLQRHARATGNLPADDGAGLLAQFATAAVAEHAMAPAAAQALADSIRARAAEHHRAGQQAAARTDDPGTPADEHTTGQVHAHHEYLAADHDQAASAAVSHAPAPTNAPASAPTVGQRLELRLTVMAAAAGTLQRRLLAAAFPRRPQPMLPPGPLPPGQPAPARPVRRHQRGMR